MERAKAPNVFIFLWKKITVLWGTIRKSKKLLTNDIISFEQQGPRIQEL